MRPYAFAHQLLPRFVFREPLLIFRILASSRGERLLREIWAASAEATGTRADDSRLPRAEPRIEITRAGPYPCVVIEMPAPSRAPEAHYIALVLGSDSAVNRRSGESAPALFCLTLEKASADGGMPATMPKHSIDLLRSFGDVWADSPGTMLCEWTSDGIHRNLGEGPPADLEAFLAAVAKRVASSVERERSSARIPPHPAPSPAAPRTAAIEPPTAVDPEDADRVRRCLHALRRHDPEIAWDAYSFDSEGMIRKPRPVETIIGLGRTAVPVLIEALNRDDRRAWAALLLGLIGGEARAAAPGLITALADPQVLVRTLAAEALGYIGYDSDRAIPALVDRLDDPDPRVRLAAAGALGNLGAPATRAVERLLDVLDDPDRVARNWASWAIRRIASDPG